MIGVSAVIVSPASPALARRMANIHAAAGQSAWDERSLYRLLAEPSTLGFAAVTGHEVVGTLIGRAVADEAEILGLAVSVSWRRRGAGRQLVETFLETAEMRGARAVFLEVARSNTAALVLYARLGFALVGQRAGYYSEKGSPVDAAVMSRALGAAATAHMRSESRLPTSSGAPKCSK